MMLHIELAQRLIKIQESEFESSPAQRELEDEANAEFTEALSVYAAETGMDRELGYCPSHHWEQVIDQVTEDM